MNITLCSTIDDSYPFSSTKNRMTRCTVSNLHSRFSIFPLISRPIQRKNKLSSRGKWKSGNNVGESNRRLSEQPTRKIINEERVIDLLPMAEPKIAVEERVRVAKHGSGIAKERRVWEERDRSPNQEIVVCDLRRIEDTTDANYHHHHDNKQQFIPSACVGATFVWNPRPQTVCRNPPNDVCPPEQIIKCPTRSR